MSDGGGIDEPNRSGVGPCSPGDRNARRGLQQQQQRQWGWQSKRGYGALVPGRHDESRDGANEHRVQSMPAIEMRDGRAVFGHGLCVFRELLLPVRGDGQRLSRELRIPADERKLRHLRGQHLHLRNPELRERVLGGQPGRRRVTPVSGRLGARQGGPKVLRFAPCHASRGSSAKHPG